MDDFLERCTKNSLKLRISAFGGGGQNKAARAKINELLLNYSNSFNSK